MRDGRTKKLTSPSQTRTPKAILSSHRAALVIVSGAMAGTEHELAELRTILGRGPGVDIVVDDAAMSRQHVAFEIVGDGFRMRDLGSTNGVLLNGEAVEAADLKHGDRLRIGGHEFRFLLEEREREPRTWVVDE